MAVTYNSVIQRLANFSLAAAANREQAEAMLEAFHNDINPDIDEVLRENPNLTYEQKRRIDELQSAIHTQINTQFPAQGGRLRRRERKNRTRAAKLRKYKQRKTRSVRRRRGTRKN